MLHFHSVHLPLLSFGSDKMGVARVQYVKGLSWDSGWGELAAPSGLMLMVCTAQRQPYVRLPLLTTCVVVP